MYKHAINVHQSNNPPIVFTGGPATTALFACEVQCTGTCTLHCIQVIKKTFIKRRECRVGTGSQGMEARDICMYLNLHAHNPNFALLTKLVTI